MKYHETPNYVCKISSSSTMANLLARLDESDLKVHYQSHLLSPLWTFQYISDTLNYLTSSKRACFIRISSLCAFSALILWSSSSWNAQWPHPSLKASSHVTSSVKLPQQTSLLKHRQFLSTILSITFYLPSLEWAVSGGQKGWVTSAS